jgi:hypothetical protein
MGTISNPRVFYGLISTGTPTKTQVANTVEVGQPQTPILLTDATKTYCVSATLATASDSVVIDTVTGIATIGTTPVTQVETATVVAASGATSNGNLAVTVTAAGVTGSPLAFSVALTTATHTTATLIAGEIRTALNANAALVAVYVVGGSGADVTLTRITAANNDATLNIAIAAGLGVSAIASSTNTAAGVGGVVLTNSTGDGKDFEGVTIGSLSSHRALLVKCISGFIEFVTAGTNPYQGYLQTGGIYLVADTAYDLDLDDLTINALSASEVEVTVTGR